MENEFDKMRCHQIRQFTASPGKKKLKLIALKIKNVRTNEQIDEYHNSSEETSGCEPVKTMIFKPKRGVCSIELKIRKEGSPPTRHSSTY